MMKFLVVAFLAIVSSGCASSSNYQNYGKLKNEINENQTSFASYIQWNEDYAVTAAHVSGVKPDFTCSSGCDLIFFKNKDTSFNKEIKWRSAEFGEPVIAVGNSQNNITRQAKGFVQKMTVVDKQGVEYFYLVNDATTIGGMSGGPVYGVDGSIVGMTIGSPKEKIKNLKSASLFVPYEVILVEWGIFNKMK